MKITTARSDENTDWEHYTSMKESWIIYRFSRLVFAGLIKVFFKTRIYGRENIPDPPYIIVSNHASLLDPPLVSMAFRKHNVAYIAKDELFAMPFVGTWVRLVKCIPVNRNGNSINSLKESLRRIKKGRVVCIFPEGTRSNDDNLRKAKRGAGFLLAKADVPVVPVYIQGSLEALPKGKRIPKPGVPINVFIGSAISTENFSCSDNPGRGSHDIISDEIMDRIRQLRDKRLAKQR